jgi:hypothetical protein
MLLGYHACWYCSCRWVTALGALFSYASLAAASPRLLALFTLRDHCVGSAVTGAAHAAGSTRLLALFTLRDHCVGSAVTGAAHAAEWVNAPAGAVHVVGVNALGAPSRGQLMLLGHCACWCCSRYGFAAALGAPYCSWHYAAGSPRLLALFTLWVAALGALSRVQLMLLLGHRACWRCSCCGVTALGALSRRVQLMLLGCRACWCCSYRGVTALGAPFSYASLAAGSPRLLALFTLWLAALGAPPCGAAHAAVRRCPTCLTRVCAATCCTPASVGHAASLQVTCCVGSTYRCPVQDALACPRAALARSRRTFNAAHAAGYRTFGAVHVYWEATELG